MTDAHPRSLTIGSRTFAWGERTYVMGIVNLSPDSFWAGGAKDIDAVLACARQHVDADADILDAGGQSTRPGFAELDAQEEIERVVPVIERLAREFDVPVSIDTYKSPVARAALEAGAVLLNDITGFRQDEAMAQLAVEFAVPAVVMHNQRDREFHDVIADIRVGFAATFSIAARAGLPRERLILDPGFGFGWTHAQNIEMLRRLPELRDYGLPLLVGASRKSSIGAVLGDTPVEERLAGSVAAAAIAVANGADIVRVHDVAETRDAVRVADVIVRGWTEPS